MTTELHIVICFDPHNGPYVWSDNTCLGEATCSATEATHETGYKCVIKTVVLQ